MTDTSETFNDIDNALADLEVVHTQEPATVTLEATEVAHYIHHQVELLKTDTNPGPRLEALRQVVALAKAWSWEDTETMPIPLYTGELSVQQTSAMADRIGPVSDGISDGVGFWVPDPKQLEPKPSQRDGGAFQVPQTYPHVKPTAFIDPKESIMPPAFPKVTPGQNYISKAAVDLIKQVDGGEELLGQLQNLLEEVAEDGDGEGFEGVAATQDSWPNDMSTPQFMDGAEAVADEDYFGTDPQGLTRK